MNILARIISFIFHPLLMATYLFALLSILLPSALYPFPQSRQLLLVGFISMVTFVLPALCISMLRTIGVISSFTMIERKERIMPFFLICIIYILFTFFFSSRNGIGLQDNLFRFLLLIDFLIIASTVITFFYKVSVHSVGVVGLLAILLPLNRVAENNSLFIPTLVLIVIAGLVMSARLQLNSHTPREVLIGAVTGLLVGFGGMILLF